MSTIFGLPISAVVGVPTRVGSGVVVGISHIVLGTHPLTLVTTVVVLRSLLGTAATATRARCLSSVSTLAGAVGGGLAVLEGA